MTVMQAGTKRKGTGKIVAPPQLAMHSDASPEWGTPMILRRFGARVLEPAAMGRAIDLDYASSVYWNQWWDEADRPHNFLDGSKGRDVLVEADRRAAAGIGLPECPRHRRRRDGPEVLGVV